MSGVVIYIDGSYCQGKKAHKNIFVNGWCMLVHADGETFEKSGAVYINQCDRGTHEFMALVECMNEVKNRRYNLENISIYTDDQAIAYINFDLHIENYSSIYLNHIERWKSLCKRYYKPNTLNEVLKFLQNVRIHKVKAHTFCVDNLRCDYIARHAANKLLKGDDFKDIKLCLDKQLKKGFKFKDPIGKSIKWYPPFVKTLISL